MKDRFDLEQDITKTHTIADQIRLIAYGVLEKQSSKDEIANALEGLAVLTDLHADKLFDTFCQSFNLDQYYNTK